MAEGKSLLSRIPFFLLRIFPSRVPLVESGGLRTLSTRVVANKDYGSSSVVLTY